MNNSFYSTLDEIVAPEHTVMLVIDVQNDFCDLSGSFARSGADMSIAEATIPRLESFLAQVRSLGLRVAFVQHLCDQEHTSPPMAERFQRNKILEHCRPGSWGASFHKTIVPRPEEPVFIKYRHGVFTNPDFEPYLRQNGIQTLVLTGLMTNVCVETAARQAHMYGYYDVAVTDCVATFSDELHRSALQNIDRYFGRISSAAELLKAWQKGTGNTI